MRNACVCERYNVNVWGPAEKERDPGEEVRGPSEERGPAEKERGLR